MTDKSRKVKKVTVVTILNPKNTEDPFDVIVVGEYPFKIRYKNSISDPSQEYTEYPVREIDINDDFELSKYLSVRHKYFRIQGGEVRVWKGDEPLNRVDVIIALDRRFSSLNGLLKSQLDDDGFSGFRYPSTMVIGDYTLSAKERVEFTRDRWCLVRETKALRPGDILQDSESGFKVELVRAFSYEQWKRMYESIYSEIEILEDIIDTDPGPIGEALEEYRELLKILKG